MPQVAIDLNLLNERSVEYAAMRAADLVAAPADVKARIRALIVRSISQGIPPLELARLIRAEIGLDGPRAQALENFRDGLEASGVEASTRFAQVEKYGESLRADRALTIARTELISALNSGQQMLWEHAVETGVLQANQFLREWIITDDEKACPICLDNAEENVAMDEEFRSGDMTPPAHPSCLVGQSLVLTGAPITAVSKRWFDGDVVVIRIASGRELTCTPNHPILTPSGWVSAGRLHIGHDVICDGRREWIFSGDRNHEHMPTAIHEIAQAFFDSREVVSSPVPVAAEDFHGDGVGSYVAIIGTDRQLRDRVEAAFDEQSTQGHLMATSHGETLPSRSGFTSMLERERNSDSGRVRSLDLRSPLSFGHVRPLQSFGLALIAHRYPGSDQAMLDDAPTGSMDLSEAINRESFSVLPHDSIDRNHDTRQGSRRLRSADIDIHTSEPISNSAARDAELAAEITCGAAVQVFTDQVVDVDVVAFHDFVFNLETDAGWYGADGIIVHNCRCAIGLVNADEKSYRAKYSPDQPRDDHGRFGEGNGVAVPAKARSLLAKKRTDGTVTVVPIQLTAEQRDSALTMLADRKTEMVVAFDAQGSIVGVTSDGKETSAPLVSPDVAAGVVALTTHNHPNGFAYPSFEDFKMVSYSREGTASTVARGRDGIVREVTLTRVKGFGETPVRLAYDAAQEKAMVGIRERWEAKEHFAEGQAVEEAVTSAWTDVAKAGFVRLNVRMIK